MSKKLHVIRINRQQLATKWSIPQSMLREQVYYVRSNALGIINWDKTVSYTPSELVGRDNVTVLPQS